MRTLLTHHTMNCWWTYLSRFTDDEYCATYYTLTHTCKQHRLIVKTKHSRMCSISPKRSMETTKLTRLKKRVNKTGPQDTRPRHESGKDSEKNANVTWRRNPRFRIPHGESSHRFPENQKCQDISPDSPEKGQKRKRFSGSNRFPGRTKRRFPENLETRSVQEKKRRT